MKFVFHLLPLAAAWKLRAGVSASCDDWNCSSGWLPKLQKALTGASNKECCVATCRVHTCSDGYTANPSYVGNTGETNDECCDRACGAAFLEGRFVCGQNQKVGDPNKAGTTASECCEATCAAHECRGLWAPDKSKANSTGNSSEACCLPTCSQVTCDPGFTYNDLTVDQPGSTKQECCVKTCELFECDEQHGWEIPAKKRHRKADKADDCCEPLCRHHECGAGWSKDVSKDDLFDPSDETCCLMQCQQVQCPEGWTADPAKRNEISSSEDFCCLPPCSSHNCSIAGYANAGAGAFGRSNGECCQKTCSLHSCSKGLRAVEGRSALSPSDERCCEPEGCSKLRSLTKLSDGTCNSLSKEDCDSHYYGSFAKSENKTIWAPCSFDFGYNLCRLGSELVGCAE
mmetsp:Transcript_8070/g.19242  ORF Transcript_8070/g.19242 Transcript_8070/m.19242 type:complete len:401 (-) Transcript_8070:60-1262(-)|eukprot:CAMPEP_0181471914 /NCGR_PEP_ID=MMETSP1110-20121109/39323_1 /TAXON_ID=174948 /ORGANISM="Symbiodinium sp., Strain CCMP421" /LENGTH=400 /DNA_ID=CAMNT_0023596953 /DNA_START=65 /DNA_END=1267 /DNA_ORIENTATION=-